MKIKKTWQYGNLTLRPATKADAQNYYDQNFGPKVVEDAEADRLTGSTQTFTEEQVIQFVKNSVDNQSHYLFLLVDEDQRIIGEAVLNEFDWQVPTANFRIIIFDDDYRDQGIGSWMIERIRDFAFEELHLHRLSLEVFSSNPRAQHAYKRAGYQKEGILKDALKVDGHDVDIIIMAILEDEWQEISRKENNIHE